MHSAHLNGVDTFDAFREQLPLSSRSNQKGIQSIIQYIDRTEEAAPEQIGFLKVIFGQWQIDSCILLISMGLTLLMLLESNCRNHQGAIKKEFKA